MNMHFTGKRMYMAYYAMNMFQIFIVSNGKQIKSQ